MPFDVFILLLFAGIIFLSSCLPEQWRVVLAVCCLGMACGAYTIGAVEPCRAAEVPR